jgi:hypothetical protein
VTGPSVDPQTKPIDAGFVARTAGDPAELASAVREVWDGRFCVASAALPEAELRRLTEAARSLPAVVGADVDPATGAPEARAYVATVDLRERLDEVAGPGVIRLTGEFRPLDLVRPPPGP